MARQVLVGGDEQEYALRGFLFGYRHRLRQRRVRMEHDAPRRHGFIPDEAGTG